MAKYLFKYRGQGLLPKTAKSRVRKRPELTLIDEAEKQLIVSGAISDLKGFGDELKGWFFTAVKSVPRPAVGAKRHPRVRRIE